MSFLSPFPNRMFSSKINVQPHMILIYFVDKFILASDNRKQFSSFDFVSRMAHFYPNIHGTDSFLHQRSSTLLKYRAELFVQWWYIRALIVKRSEQTLRLKLHSFILY